MGLRAFYANHGSIAGKTKPQFQEAKKENERHRRSGQTKEPFAAWTDDRGGDGGFPVTRRRPSLQKRLAVARGAMVSGFHDAECNLE